MVNLWVDGGFYRGHAVWGFAIERDNKLVDQRCGILKGDVNRMRQIGGELKATIEGLSLCTSNGESCNIYYDYVGIYKWACGARGEKAWKAKNDFIKHYVRTMELNQHTIVDFVKVKSHSNVEWNEYVDILVRNTAKQAIRHKLI